MIVDAFEFCRQAERREGVIAVANLPRLAEDCFDTSGEVRWSLQGGTHAHGYPQWQLQVNATVQLKCQRCLAPFAFEVASHSTLIIARDDEKADEMEVELDDDALDVIVGSRNFDVQELVEDEALLALPLAPKHQQCESAVSSDSDEDGDENEAGSPFSGLRGLKQ